MNRCRHRCADVLAPHWDAVVLGAGPAGAIAARQLGLAGYSVLLVEKCRWPRFKTCGGCLGGGALHVLEELGLGHVPRECNAVPLRSITLRSGHREARIPAGRRVAVARELFDAAIVDEALSAGVKFVDQTEGSLLPPDRPDSRLICLQSAAGQQRIRARLVLVATGLSKADAELAADPRDGSLIGLGTIIRGAIGSPFDREAGVLHMICGDDGYVGVAPLGDRQYDVAVAVQPAALQHRTPWEAVASMFELSGVDPPRQLESAAWRGTPPLTRTARRRAAHRTLVLGDAAGYVEPFTGEGISWALESAVLASSFAATAIDHWDANTAREWERTYAAAFRQRHRRCQMISWLLRNRTLRQAALWGLARAPRLARPVLRCLDRPVDSLDFHQSRCAHAS